jgi:hypothetical protein
VREQKPLGCGPTPRLGDELARDAGVDLAQPHQDGGVRPIVVREVERARVGLEEDVTVGEVQLDGDGVAVFLEPGHELLPDVEGRRPVTRALRHIGQRRGKGAQLRPGQAAGARYPVRHR